MPKCEESQPARWINGRFVCGAKLRGIPLSEACCMRPVLEGKKRCAIHCGVQVHKLNARERYFLAKEKWEKEKPGVPFKGFIPPDLYQEMKTEGKV